jgi:hypothetical protein
MKIGDLVKTEYSEAVGIIVDMIQRKVWRTGTHGLKVDWSKVDPEPHAVILYSHNDGTVDIPITDLEVVK